MAIQVKMIPAVIFYLLYLSGLVIFAVSPILQEQNSLLVISFGLLLGLIAYASYDLTNMSVIKNWSISLSLLDIGWALFVSILSAMTGFFAAQIFAGS
jgi:uncharacterized membrane protein